MKNLLIISLLFFACTSIADNNGLQVGEQAPDFRLKNVDGEMVSLKDFENAEGYIVIFTCNHCPYSQMYEDRINALNKEYASKGYPVIAINPNDSVTFPSDSYSHMIQRAEEKGFTFPYLYDETQEVAKAYGAKRTPHVFLLNKDRKVMYIGAIDDNSRSAAAVKTKYVEEAIAALQAGKKPNPDFTKAIGCSIKWREE